MQFWTVFVAAIAFCSGQRPSYAGTGPKGLPELASRFKDPNETTTVRIYNRLGSDSGTTLRIPVDARGDGELVDRLSQWPRENKPFWLLNAEAIEQHRNSRPAPNNAQGNNNNNNVQQTDLTASRFSDSALRTDSIPVRPNQPRSSFLSTLTRQ